MSLECALLAYAARVHASICALLFKMLPHREMRVHTDVFLPSMQWQLIRRQSISVKV